MSTASLITALYLLAGIMFLVIFDLLTKRVRSHLKDATYDTQTKLLNANVAVKAKTATIIILFLTWLFWPAVACGAVDDRFRHKEKK